MKKLFLSLLIASSLWSIAHSQDIMLQGWYWDYPKTGQGKFWVDTIAQRAQKLSHAGFNYLWIPPMSLAAGGFYSNGYDIYDLFNLGGTYGANTAFGNRTRIDKMIDSLNLYNIVPIADMIYNHRANGKPEDNAAVEGWIENYNLTKHNNGDACYPSDRFRCILPVGGSTGLDSGIYYFKIHSASASADYYNKPYTVYMNTKKKGWANLPDLMESANNGGGDCGQSNDNIILGRKIKATVDAGGCGTDEFELSITTADYFTTGDTIFITITNDDGNYSDHFIYGIWCTGSNPDADVVSQLRYQTYTNFASVPSGRGDMHALNFKPNGNPTCLCGDWDAMLFYYDVDQYVPASADTFDVWTRWMMEDVGVKGLRMDAIKNFTPEFTGNLLDYLHDHGDDPKLVVGESYDFDAGALKTRLDDVYSYMDQDTKDAMYFSVFDFSLQACLRDACDAFGYDTRNVFGCGMHGSQQIYRKNIVTFVNNHDFREAPQSADTDPILAYAYILTNPVIGIPCVYWSDYYSSNYPSYTSDMNKLMSAHYKFIQGAQDVDYLNRYSTPYASNYISGGANTSLLYQLSNMSNTCLPNRDVIVAINFSGSPLKVDMGVNTSSPYHLQQGDTLVDILGRSNYPYAIINGSHQIYVELPARSYSIWARVSPITQSPAVSANGTTEFCHGGNVVLSAATSNSCHSYQWKRNNVEIEGASNTTYTATTSGNYQLVESYNGAMAHYSNIITVTVNPEHPEISYDGILLNCSVSNVSYQWYFGTTYTALNPIAGATSQSYMPPQSGYYQVQITDANNCTDFSEVFPQWMVGISTPSLDHTVEVFPNPAGEQIGFRLQITDCRLVEVYDLVGRKLISVAPSNHSSSDIQTMDIKNLSSGIYYLKFIFDEGVVTKKFEKR